MSETGPRPVVALKEWSALCEELGTGRQILLLRAGGILDRGPADVIPGRAPFHLFPTRFHQAQDPEELSPLLQRRDDAPAPPPAGEVRLPAWARLRSAHRVDDLATALALAGHAGLSRAAVRRRFAYREPGLVALVLRVHRPVTPAVIPARERYDGCRSWVELENAPAPAGDAPPALDDATFEARARALEERLAPPAPPLARIAAALAAGRYRASRMPDGRGMIVDEETPRVATLEDREMVVVEAVGAGVRDEAALHAHLVRELGPADAGSAAELAGFTEELARFLDGRGGDGRGPDAPPRP